MNWLRLYITVEGQTERKFAEETLVPHLANDKYSIDTRVRVVLTNRKLGKRGGVMDYQTIRGDIHRLMLQDRNPQAWFTTMVDLYALPKEFPGWAEARKKSSPLGRVTTLEEAMRADFNHTHFLPYIQLHEFEALLYCDLQQLRHRITGSDVGVANLAKEVAGLHPEEINEGPMTGPSKRLIRHVPIYERIKVRVGAPAASAIGLNALRVKCPHFNRWIANLEALAAKPPS